MLPSKYPNYSAQPEECRLPITSRFFRMLEKPHTLILSAALLVLSACNQSDSTIIEDKTSSATTEQLSQDTAKSTPPMFVDRTKELSVNFVHDRGATPKMYMPEIMGSGVALLDVDNDGDLDIYFVQGGDVENQNTSRKDRFYLNTLSEGEPNSLSFTDVSDQYGTPASGYGMGVATGDIDNDGYIDLYVTNMTKDIVLRNKEGKSFEDMTESSGINHQAWTVPATFFDYDGDGDLDLYSGSYVDFRLASHRDCFSSTGLPDYCSPHSYSALSDRLFENNGNGRFSDVSAKSGLRGVPSKALGVISGDFNTDGKLDLYVANDGVANQLWINQGDGTFEDEALFSGSALNYEGMPEASMGVDAADVDADGDEDLFMTHLRGETNTIYLNQGDGVFEDTTISLGLAGPSIPYTGFGTAWFDVENDGKLDILAANGAVTVEEALVRKKDQFPYHQPNQLFRNVSTDTRIQFEQYTHEENPLDASYVSRGAAFGDLDNDGDVDVIIANNSGPARVLINSNNGANSWLGLRVLLNDRGTDALGAMVTLKLANGQTFSKRVKTAGSYVSASDPRLIFGLGDYTDSVPIAALVQWPDGGKEEFVITELNQYITLVKGHPRADKLQK